MDPTDIACWQRIDERITTSGRLREEDLDHLRDCGVSTIINLALADSPGILRDEDKCVERRGMNYVHIPVPFPAPDEGHYSAFVDAMAEAEGEQVHVHCVMNWRVSAFLYRFNRDVAGMDEPSARALMQQQWSPEESDHEDAPAWSAFIKARER